MNLIYEPLGRKFKRISLLSQSYLQENLVGIDINHSFYPLLLIDAGNGMTQQELANILLCDKVQVVRIINYLSSHGYVERIQRETDKRKYELRITAKAELIIPKIKSDFKKNTQVMLNGISDLDISKFNEILSKIESNLILNKLSQKK